MLPKHPSHFRTVTEEKKRLAAWSSQAGVVVLAKAFFEFARNREFQHPTSLSRMRQFVATAQRELDTPAARSSKVLSTVRRVLQDVSPSLNSAMAHIRQAAARTAARFLMYVLLTDADLANDIKHVMTQHFGQALPDEDSRVLGVLSSLADQHRTGITEKTAPQLTVTSFAEKYDDTWPFFRQVLMLCPGPSRSSRGSTPSVAKSRPLPTTKRCAIERLFTSLEVDKVTPDRVPQLVLACVGNPARMQSFVGQCVGQCATESDTRLAAARCARMAHAACACIVVGDLFSARHTVQDSVRRKLQATSSLLARRFVDVAPFAQFLDNVSASQREAQNIIKVLLTPGADVGTAVAEGLSLSLSQAAAAPMSAFGDVWRTMHGTLPHRCTGVGTNPLVRIHSVGDASVVLTLGLYDALAQLTDPSRWFVKDRDIIVRLNDGDVFVSLPSAALAVKLIAGRVLFLESGKAASDAMCFFLAHHPTLTVGRAQSALKAIDPARAEPMTGAHPSAYSFLPRPVQVLVPFGSTLHSPDSLLFDREFTRLELLASKALSTSSPAGRGTKRDRNRGRGRGRSRGRGRGREGGKRARSRSRSSSPDEEAADTSADAADAVHAESPELHHASLDGVMEADVTPSAQDVQDVMDVLKAQTEVRVQAAVPVVLLLEDQKPSVPRLLSDAPSKDESNYVEAPLHERASSPAPGIVTASAKDEHMNGDGQLVQWAAQLALAAVPESPARIQRDVAKAMQAWATQLRRKRLPEQHVDLVQKLRQWSETLSAQRLPEQQQVPPPLPSSSPLSPRSSVIEDLRAWSQKLRLGDLPEQQHSGASKTPAVTANRSVAVQKLQNWMQRLSALRDNKRTAAASFSSQPQENDHGVEADVGARLAALAGVLTDLPCQREALAKAGAGSKQEFMKVLRACVGHVKRDLDALDDALAGVQ
jgi:hypothetical protein